MELNLTDSEYAYCKTTWLIPKNSLIKLMVDEYDSEYYQFRYRKI